MDASTWMVTGFVLSKYWSELVEVTAFLILSTADWCSGPHWKSLLFFVRSQRLADREARLGTKRLRNCTMPRKVCRSAGLAEGSMLVIAFVFCGSGRRPRSLMIFPKKGISVHLILHLSGLKRRPVSRARSITALKFASCSLWSRP